MEFVVYFRADVGFWKPAPRPFMFCLILLILFFSRRCWYWSGYSPYHYGYYGPYRGYAYGAYPYGAYGYYNPYYRGYYPYYRPYGCY